MRGEMGKGKASISAAALIFVVQVGIGVILFCFSWSMKGIGTSIRKNGTCGCMYGIDGCMAVMNEWMVT